MCKQYNMEDHDFSQYIVSRCLPDTSDEGDDKYICILCHKRLVEANPENVSLPYFVNNRCVNAGAKFLKALQEKLQYVCTCCHHLLFHKTVVPFHLQEYDTTNDTVKKSLSHCYRMKLHKNQTSQEHCQYMQHEWPQISQNYPHTWRNLFVSAVDKTSNRENQKCLIKHVQMDSNWMIFHKIYNNY